MLTCATQHANIYVRHAGTYLNEYPAEWRAQAMIIRNVTHAQLADAMATTNRQYADNIKFKRCDRTSRPWMPGAVGTYRVTLTVADSSKPGSRRSTNRYRADGSPARISAACWHAHGAFMEALPPSATVITSPMLIGQKSVQWHPGEPLQDFSIGSQMYPCMASEACEC